MDFLTTQMFFDNSILYNFCTGSREKGITVPVIPGIMPVTSGSQIKRIGFLSGTALPERFRAVVDRFGDDKELCSRLASPMRQIRLLICLPMALTTSMFIR